MTVTPGSAQTHAQWQKLAAAVVNKSRSPEQQLDPAAAEESMRSTLPGGLVIDPLYLKPEHPRPLGVAAAMPFTRGRAPRNPELPWDVRQLHDDPDGAESAKAVLTDLYRGVTSVWLHVGSDGIAASDLPVVLADVMLHLAPVSLSSWDAQAEGAAALVELIRSAPEGAAEGTNLGLDPIGAAARAGGTPDLSGLAGVVRELGDLANVRAITVDTRPYADAGAAAPEELGFAVAAATAYLRRLQEDGVDLAVAFPQLEFRLTATADQFLTTAKFRALRRLWARVGEVCGVPEADRGARTHAVTAPRMFSRNDPWVNVLRSTLATFGASVGGADAITVLPYDTTAGLPTPFSRRLARNTQLLLSDESNVAKVVDPAGGSWYTESLTDDLAQRAWRVFQDIEAAGGMVQALADGEIARRCAAADAELGEALAHRTAQLTGVSMFPLLDEAPTERRARPTLVTTEGALPVHRDADAFEALRSRAAAYAKEHGAAPTVPLLTLGTQRQFGARQMWVMNLLAVAGIRTTDAPAAAPVALIASDKAGYAEFAADAVASLREAGAERVLIAGNSAQGLADTSLVDGKVAEGMDVVAFLTEILDRFGAPAAPTTKGASA